MSFYMVGEYRMIDERLFTEGRSPPHSSSRMKILAV